jgi:hypothetical protein
MKTDNFILQGRKPKFTIKVGTKNIFNSIKKKRVSQSSHHCFFTKEKGILFIKKREIRAV